MERLCGGIESILITKVEQKVECVAECKIGIKGGISVDETSGIKSGTILRV